MKGTSGRIRSLLESPSGPCRGNVIFAAICSISLELGVGDINMARIGRVCLIYLCTEAGVSMHAKAVSINILDNIIT